MLFTHVPEESQHLIVGSVVRNEESEIGITQHSGDTDLGYVSLTARSTGKVKSGSLPNQLDHQAPPPHSPTYTCSPYLDDDARCKDWR